MSELMHYGVPGMKWGVRHQRNAPRPLKRLEKRAAKYTTEKNGNSLTRFAKNNTEQGIKYGTRNMSKEDAELYKLNAYSDAAIANNYLNKRDRDTLSRLESGNMRSNEQIVTSIFGKNFVTNQLKSSIKITDELSAYYAEKGKEAIKNLSDMGVMYEPVSSYRTFGSGNSTISWQGTEYVPYDTSTDAKDGDRVLVTIKNRRKN